MLRWSERDIARLRMVLETERQQSTWAMARKAQETIKHRSIQAIAHKIRELISEEENTTPGFIVIDDQEYKTRNISGYVHIYIDGREVPVHIYLWEKEHGKVPSGYVVHHRDNCRLNNTIDNLTIMTSSEHISYHHSGTPPETEMLFWFLQSKNLWNEYLEFREQTINEVNNG